MCTSLCPIWFVHGTHLDRFVPQIGALRILKAAQNKHDLLHQRMK